MDWLSQFDSLGHLELIETFEYYDRPLLFACQNATGTVFLAVLAKEERGSETWLFAPMSRRRFEAARSGRVDLHDAFAGVEDETVYIAVLAPESHQKAVIVAQPADLLPDEMLPGRGERLLLPTETLPKLDNDLLRRAVQEQREFLKFRLTLPNVLTSEAPAQLLGDVLTSTQDLVSAIGQVISDEPTARGPLPKDVVTTTELRVVAIGPGSFQVQLASADYVDLFQESAAGKAISELVSLVAESNDRDALRLRLQQLKIRVAARYVDLLLKLSDKVSETEIEWASPKGALRRTARITSAEASAAIEVIRRADIQPPEEQEVVGRLVGASLSRQSFELEVIRGKRTDDYKGTVVERALDALQGAVLGARYRATIRTTRRLQSTTDKIEIEHELIDLRQEH